MILLDREDVVRLTNDGMWTYPFYVNWDPENPALFQRGEDLDFPDIIADGPFVLIVNDEYAWAGRDVDHLYEVAKRRKDAPNFKSWKALADLYAKEMGISRQSLLLRYAAMSRRLRRDHRSQWRPWDEIYHWPDGSDLAYSALTFGKHPWLVTREHEGERQVRFA